MTFTRVTPGGGPIRFARWVVTLAVSGLLAQGLATQEAKILSKPRDVSAEEIAQVDVAVRRGLAWLAANQNSKGFWTGLIGAKRGDGYYEMRPLREQERNGTGHLGVSALCGMAFLAGGHVPGRGEYGAIVQRTVDAVLSGLTETGLITVGGTRMYSHALATLFLAEVHGMTRDSRLKKALEKATHIIIDCQNVYGAWRYNAFSARSDISVTVCMLQALRAARNIGIEVPKSVIDKAVRFVKDCRIEFGQYAGNYYYYAPYTQNGRGGRGRSKRDHFAIQAAAVTSLVSAGIYDRKLIEPPLEFMLEDMSYMAREYRHHYHFWYGHYYACQAFFHADVGLRNGIFKRYYRAMRDHLLQDQEADGRWQNSMEEGPGDPFGTAVACIVLQVPNQYLPIFQR